MAKEMPWMLKERPKENAGQKWHSERPMGDS